MTHKLESTLSINGVVVEKTGDIKGGIQIYKPVHKDEDTRYFVKQSDGSLMFTLSVSADCGHNTGYVDSIEIDGVPV